MTLTAPFRNALFAIIAACLLGGAVSAFTVKGNDAKVRVVASGSTTTTTLAGAVVDSAGTGGGEARPVGSTDSTVAASSATTAKVSRSSATTVTTAAGAKAATTAAAPADLGAPQDPGPAAPPKPGTYKYNYTADGKQNEATEKVEDKGTAGNETRQQVTQKGSGLEAMSDVSWRPDGLYILKTTFTFGDQTAECDWQPDTQQLKLPLTKGATWSSDSTCTISGVGPAPITVKRHLEGTVGDLQRVKVGDQVLDVWSIAGKEHLEFAGSVVDSTSTTLFSPKYGLTAKTTAHAKSTGPDGKTQEGDSTLELVSVTPS